MGGINFNQSQVDIRGDVVNIEGDQINVAQAPVEDVLRVIVTVLRTGSVDEVTARVAQLDQAASARPELTSARVAEAVQHEVSGVPEEERGRLRAIAAKIGEGAATSAISQGIVLGLRAIVGV